MKFKICTTILLIIAATAGLFAQKKELKSITEKDLKAHLEFIASDYLQGRDFGTDIPGLELTAEYLKAQAMKMGLNPGGESYFQTVDMVSVKPDFENTLVKVLNKSGEETFNSQDVFSFSSSAKNDTIKGNVVFAGYGWIDESEEYDDLEGLDLKDKLVLVMTRNRKIALDTTLSSNTSTEMAKMEWIFKAGAKGILFVQDPLNPENRWFDMVKGYVSKGTYTQPGKERSFLPGKIIFVSNEIANKLIEEKGKTIDELQGDINSTGNPASFEIENASIEIQLNKFIEPVSGKNVLAVIEGSDPVLKNECVVFTAHYDHVGVTTTGEINNGADDNGSGTVALLEIAEAFTKMKKKPKRSIVFAWVTAEEKGLIGSGHYSENPVIPLENTLVNINLDMVGRSAEIEPAKEATVEKSLAGPNGLYVVSGGKSSELIEISDKACREFDLIPSDEISKAFLTRSDHFHFYKNGVPILGVSTGLHDDYHTPGDKLGKIDYNKMKRVAQYCFLVANEVANKKKRIEVDNPVTKQ